jgi:hypothetical protein
MLLAVDAAGVHFTGNSAKPCGDDADCNYAGHCASGECTCDAPFSGPACETFQLFSCVVILLLSLIPAVVRGFIFADLI